MAVATGGGVVGGSVGANGLQQFVNGDPLEAADLNVTHGDIQAPLSFNGLAGVLTGGVCTASALDVSIPVGTQIFALQVWNILTAAVVVPVPDNATTWIWWTSAGEPALVASMGAFPPGFDSRNSCLITKAVALSGVVTLDNTVQHRARYSDGLNRKIIDGPLVIDYGNNLVNISTASAFQIPEVAADPTVPGTGTFAWYRSDLDCFTLSVDGVIKRLYDGEDVALYMPTVPTASQILLEFQATRKFTLPSGLTGSRGSSGVASTAAKVFDIQVNGVSKGSANWAAAATTATFTFTTAVSIVAGDIIAIVAPATPDATIARIRITLKGN